MKKRTRTWFETDNDQINYKKILNNILQNDKKILPTLLGIDKNFDKVLAQKLRRKNNMKCEVCGHDMIEESGAIQCINSRRREGSVSVEDGNIIGSTGYEPCLLRSKGCVLSQVSRGRLYRYCERNWESKRSVIRSQVREFK